MQILNMNRLWRTLYISGALATLRTEMLNSISTRSTQNKLKQSELGSKILPPSRCFQQQRIPLTTLGAGKHLEPARLAPQVLCLTGAGFPGSSSDEMTQWSHLAGGCASASPWPAPCSAVHLLAVIPIR